MVTKVPRFAFEKFPGAEGELTTHMKSVGEAMAIGRTFRESFAKAMRSRELDAEAELPARRRRAARAARDPARRPLRPRRSRRSGAGSTVDQVHERTSIDPWFLRELRALAVEGDGTEGLDRTFRSVDTCAAEFEARTPVLLLRATSATRPLVGEVRRGERESVVILGSGPNRIGQGIEFDYCCVHAAMTVRESGRDAVIINCNPETVSTDYDTSDRLYFEPLTAADVLAVIEVEQPEGVIVQFGGQTPLRLAKPLQDAGVPLLGTPGRRDRPGRGPGPLRGAAAPAGDRAPAVRHRALGRGGGDDRRGRRLPAARPALVRARRSGDGDLLLRRRASASTWSAT